LLKFVDDADAIAGSFDAMMVTRPCRDNRRVPLRLREDFAFGRLLPNAMRRILMAASQI